MKLDKLKLIGITLDFVLIILYIAVLFELLLPILTITTIEHPLFLFCFISLVFLLTFWKIPIIWQFLSVILTILIFYYYLYGDFNLYQESKKNLDFILQGDFNFTNRFNTLLFMLVMFFLIKLLTYFLRKKYFYYIYLLSTFLYLAVIDTFVDYQADWGVVRLFIYAGLIALLKKQEFLLFKLQKNLIFSWRWLLSAIILISLMATIGIIVPKRDASWEDPFGWFSNLPGKGVKFFSEFKKTGYDDNDNYLGGPFIQDKSIVFHTIANEKTYWRGDSKDFYTGKGWVSSFNGNSNLIIQENDKGSFYNPVIQEKEGSLFNSDTLKESKEIHSLLNFANSKYSTFFYGGVWEKLSAKENDLTEINYNLITGNLAAKKKLKTYEITSYQPIFSLELLKNNSIPKAEGVLTQYLQLPVSLPLRVRELAEKLTANLDNPYDKALAIQNYLRTNYTYQIEDIPYPQENEDFVDQFLFMTKKGYCDHFSTSMVVLARTAGIPARWVKGFSPGEVAYDAEKKVYTGIVRNKDAHSWVEIYINDIGWVPFEPTPSFYMPIELKSTNLAVDKEKQVDKIKNQTNINREKDLLAETFSQAAKQESNLLLNIFIVIIILFLISIGITYYFRTPLYLFFVDRKLKEENVLKNYVILYTSYMLKGIRRKYGLRGDSQTIRDYMKNKFNNEEEQKKAKEDIISIFELARYSNHSLAQEMLSKIKNAWQKLLK